MKRNPEETRGRKEEFKPELIVKALKKYHGMIYIAAESLKCHPQTIYNYMERYPEVRDALTHAKERMLDFAEAKLAEAIQAREAWAICFYLKTQGKRRGYVENPMAPQYGDANAIAREFAKVVSSAGAGVATSGHQQVSESEGQVQNKSRRKKELQE